MHLHSWGPEVVPGGTGAGDSWIHISLFNQESHLRRNTAGAVSITTVPFAAGLNFFKFFTFFIINFKKIDIRNKKKVFKKFLTSSKKFFAKF
jgi:hypothetical protein